MMTFKRFKNEPLTDFSKLKNEAAMKAALMKVRATLGKTYPLIINGKETFTKKTFQSLNPANIQEVIGTFQEADETVTEKAIEGALHAFHTWRDIPAKERAQKLFQMAALMRQQKFELAAWLILESGKNWYEADGDVAEAIDFLEYYGREMLRLSTPPRLVKSLSEKNQMVYIPLGVGAIITPWNFPLAILTGMTTSAIVTGNTVVVKPSEFAPAVAYQFMKIVKDVGLPDGVIQYLTGQGATVGKKLVEHPDIRFISFTGSKKVGLEITEVAHKTTSHQRWIKRVITELGGKDAIVVDREADIDSAVSGVLRSAFGFSGQKCSACSRAIIDETIYEKFTKKLVEKTKQISMGNPQEKGTFVGPVISQPSIEKVRHYLEVGKQEGTLLVGGEIDTSQGYFVKPTIFGEVSPSARLAQEEIFAPVLALIKSKNFDEALDIANGTDYALTGAFYTKNPEKIKKGIQRFHVGNLYVNRGCTGAQVGVHPFGGFNMSGTDSKAGGPDYLHLFMQAKTISEQRSKR